MTRWFNIAGPCFEDEHYMIPPERRARPMLPMIEQGRWFTLVSGWQTGKTTVLRWVRQTLNAAGRYVVLQVDLEAARDQPDLRLTLATVLRRLDRVVERELPSLARPSAEQIDAWLRVPTTALSDYLTAFCRALTKPLVLLLDEADGLVGEGMVSFLTQLRELYLARKDAPAPYAVVLAGRRAVRDYAFATEEHRVVSWLGSSSPFNVTVETVSLAAFTANEVEELLAQHTAETGQVFTPDAVAAITELSQGHPWLVNALADQITRRDVTDRAAAVTASHVEQAKETIIHERRTHIDSLVARLREERVRRILDPMLAGEATGEDVLDDDFAYVAGLGLIRMAEGRWVVSNPIYREVIPRALTAVRQAQIPAQTSWYVRADGALDMPKLMAAWQEFWREDGHLAAEGFNYKESGSHLMLMAFLQRVVNGGGRIEREYALGRGALDLLVAWKTWRYAIELKVWRLPTTESKGLMQLGRCLDTLGLDEGWLVIFRNDPTLSWDERIFTRTELVGARRIHVLGC